MSWLQDEHEHSLSYKQMAVIVSKETGKKANRKRVLRVMREEGLQSSVRKRRYSEEVYAGKAGLLRNGAQAQARLGHNVPSLTRGDDVPEQQVELYNSEISAWGISDHSGTALSWRRSGSSRSVMVGRRGLCAYTSLSYRGALGYGRAWVTQLMLCRDEVDNGIIKTEALYAKLGKTR